MSKKKSKKVNLVIEKGGETYTLKITQKKKHTANESAKLYKRYGKLTLVEKVGDNLYGVYVN